MKIMKPSSNISTFTLFLILALPLSGRAEVKPSDECKKNPAVMGQCRTVNGTISLYNGTPSMRIHLDNSKRVLAITPAENEIMPRTLKEKISFEQSVHAKLLVCPLSPYRNGTMQSVCVESATHIMLVKP